MQNQEYWVTRRSVRKFSDRCVSDELIDRIVERASHAPTTGNMQLYSVVVSRDKSMLARLAPAHFSQPAFVNAPVALTFCADFNRFGKWCEASGAEPGFDNFQSFMSALLDTAIFAQQFCTIAEQEDLGCCYLGTTTYNAELIADVLKLPGRVVPVTTLSLGYPDGDAPVSDRLPAAAVIHREVYREESPVEVRRYFKEKEERDDSMAFVRENGKETLAQVFTDVRYPRSTNEEFSRRYYDFIARAGFSWPLNG